MKGVTKEYWLDNIAKQEHLDMLTNSQVQHLMLYTERKANARLEERKTWTK